MKLREEFEQLYPFVPWKELEILTDEEDSFSYLSPSGTVVGWNRNTELFWRNRDAGSDTEEIL